MMTKNNNRRQRRNVAIRQLYGRQRLSLHRNQQGMAAILITMVTMIVVALIVLGFATISRREQTNTLNQQLSTQAFYAAESAVNDARDVIDAAVNNGQAVPAKTSCDTNSDGGAYTPNYPVPAAGNSGVVLDSAHNVSYTCLLVNPTPTSIVKDGVGADSWVVPVTSSSAFDTIQLQWTPDPANPGGTPSAQCPGSTGQFSPASGAGQWNCKYSVLRVDLVPTSGALTTAGMTSGQLTGFFEPQSAPGGANLPYDAAHIGNANVVAASCDEAAYGTCTATISGLSGTSYTLRLISLYGTSNVTITPESGGSPVATSSEVMVDATGDANGVLRRIQVRLPITDYSGIIPDDAIQSNSALCKRFLVTPTYYANAGDVVNPQTNTADPNYNAMCDNNLPPSGTP